MDLFPYGSAITLSCVGVALLSAAFILNFMQLSVQPSLEIMPCQIAFLLSDLVFHKSR